MTKGYTALKLTDTGRSDLLRAFPAQFANAVAHHVTLAFGVGEDASLPDVDSVDVVGHAIGDGVQAVVVAVNGDTSRDDGGTLHVTVSLDDGHKPVESNAVIADGFVALDNPATVSVEPVFIPFGG